MPKHAFYAVRVGRAPGVYRTWAECEAQVKGVSGARFKGFPTRQTAADFVAGRVEAPMKEGGASRTAAASRGARSGAPAAAPGAFEVYTDGGCEGNRGVANRVSPAGWGVCVTQDGSVIAELYGPVDLDTASPTFRGARVASNNTGELSAIAEALAWLRDVEGGHAPARVRYDSEYAAKITQKIFRASKNVELAETCQRLFASEHARRHGGVSFAHVKGHSGDRFNDRADALVQLGKRGLRSSDNNNNVPPPTAAPPPPAAARVATKQPPPRDVIDLLSDSDEDTPPASSSKRAIDLSDDAPRKCGRIIS